MLKLYGDEPLFNDIVSMLVAMRVLFHSTHSTRAMRVPYFRVSLTSESNSVEGVDFDRLRYKLSLFIFNRNLND